MASATRRIYAYNAGISAPMRELKWAALRESKFRFYRGTCHLFAEDFVKLYKYKPRVRTWICGDLHFENFGSFKGENRLVYFDLNDFDESVLASPEPEVARFLTSIIIAAADMKVAAIALHKALHDIADAYVGAVLKRKALMLEEEVSHGIFRRYFEHLDTFDRQDFIAKRIVKNNGAVQLKPDNLHFMPLSEERKEDIYNGLRSLLDGNPKFQHLIYEDAAYRIAGTGSLGLERYGVLCYSKKKGKRYLIDVKEARESCFTGLIKGKQPRLRNEAERVNTVGYLMQFNTPAFLATLKMGDKWYMVKELQFVADRISLADLNGDFGELVAVAKEMAVLMAYAHLRSCGQLGSSTADELVKFAEKQQWVRDIVELSGDMAKRNNKYYKSFCADHGHGPDGEGD